jgi:hypothetical protein
MKEFQSNDLVCLKDLEGKSVNSIFYQPVADILAYVDMFVVNFGEPPEISFHIFSLFRVISKNSILLTTTDCFFDNNFERLTSEKAENERNSFYKDTLLYSNIERVKSALKDAKVSNAYATDIGDVIIEFDNSLTMEIRIDALCNQECYRVISYTEKPSTHNIVTCNNGKVFYDIE